MLESKNKKEELSEILPYRPGINEESACLHAVVVDAVACLHAVVVDAVACLHAYFFILLF